MTGFDHRSQAVDRAEDERAARRETRNLAHDVLAIILAGGRGSRLAELTAWRAKPAVPFGGKFRIIDFTLSNCVNSGIRRIGICTQYKAQSLIHHVQRGWSFLDGRFGEFVDDDGRRGMAVDSLISGGCIVSGSTVRRSVLFSNVNVQNFCEIEDCVILPNVEIGNNVVLKRAVVDKCCRLPDGLQVGVDAAMDRKRFHVTDRGVTVIVPESLGQRVHHLR